MHAFYPNKQRYASHLFLIRMLALTKRHKAIKPILMQTKRNGMQR